MALEEGDGVFEGYFFLVDVVAPFPDGDEAEVDGPVVHVFWLLRLLPQFVEVSSGDEAEVVEPRSIRAYFTPFWMELMAASWRVELAEVSNSEEDFFLKSTVLIRRCSLID